MGNEAARPAYLIKWLQVRVERLQKSGRLGVAVLLIVDEGLHNGRDVKHTVQMFCS